MLDRLKKMFARPGAPADDADETTISVAALLVEAARADETYTEREQALIEAALVERFGVAPHRAREMRARGETLQANANDIYRFTKGAKSLAPADKVALLESLWRIVLSDADRHSWEDTLIRRVCGLLHVSDVESGHARQRVEKAMRE